MRSSAWGFEAFQAYQTQRFGPAAFCLIGGIDEVAALASIATLDGGSQPPGSRTLSRDRAHFRRLSFEYFDSQGHLLGVKLGGPPLLSLCKR
jgi:hypothetical protein